MSLTLSHASSEKKEQQSVLRNIEQAYTEKNLETYLFNAVQKVLEEGYPRKASFKKTVRKYLQEKDVSNFKTPSGEEAIAKKELDLKESASHFSRKNKIMYALNEHESVDSFVRLIGPGFVAGNAVVALSAAVGAPDAVALVGSMAGLFGGMLLAPGVGLCAREDVRQQDYEKVKHMQVALKQLKRILKETSKPTAEKEGKIAEAAKTAEAPKPRTYPVFLGKSGIRCSR